MGGPFNRRSIQLRPRLTPSSWAPGGVGGGWDSSHGHHTDTPGPSSAALNLTVGRLRRRRLHVAAAQPRRRLEMRSISRALFKLIELLSEQTDAALKLSVVGQSVRT